jgi:23S rRNA C2498 (ribose-2'-O)-methylase RlmM
MTIQIEGFTRKQSMLADIIWACETQEQVTNLIASLPKRDRIQAQIVLQMIVTATFDQSMDTDLAETVLAQFRL